jgi:Phage terminase large subunit (GpA)
LQGLCGVGPLFAASRVLTGVLRDESRVGQRVKNRSTMLSRFFPGGSLRIVAARAPRNDVLCITCGVDLQDDRAEATLAGFARDGTCFVLAHQVIYGPTVAEQVWQDLDDMLKQRWPHPHGGTF